jgi:hypothetical protein
MSVVARVIRVYQRHGIGYILRRCWHEGIRAADNFFLDLRSSGQFLGGNMESRYASSGANGTQSSDYLSLSYIFGNLVQVRDSDVLVDVGCGKGRIIFWWLSRGYQNRMIGIELDEKVARATKNRLRRYNNVTIICGNALEHIPRDATLLYMANPFSTDDVWKLFKQRLVEVFGHNEDLKIVYYHCLHADVFENDPKWEVHIQSILPRVARYGRDTKVAIIRMARLGLLG